MRPNEGRANKPTLPAELQMGRDKESRCRSLFR